MTAYEHFLIRHRIYCEHPDCQLQQGKVVRKIDGHDKVLCFEHDPQQVQDFISWMESTGQHLDAESFGEWILQNEDAI